MHPLFPSRVCPLFFRASHPLFLLRIYFIFHCTHVLLFFAHLFLLCSASPFRFRASTLCILLRRIHFAHPSIFLRIRASSFSRVHRCVLVPLLSLVRAHRGFSFLETHAARLSIRHLPPVFSAPVYILAVFSHLPTSAFCFAIRNLAGLPHYFPMKLAGNPKFREAYRIRGGSEVERSWGLIDMRSKVCFVYSSARCLIGWNLFFSFRNLWTRRLN